MAECMHQFGHHGTGGPCAICNRAEREQAVLAAAEERFVAYMTERHYHNEDDVLRNMSRLDTPATRLIRAVAEWRKAKQAEES